MPLFTSIILGSIFILVGILLKFYPLLLNTLSEEQKPKMDKKKLSKYLLISFSSLGLVLIALSFLGEVSTVISVVLIPISSLFIVTFATRYTKK